MLKIAVKEIFLNAPCIQAINPDELGGRLGIYIYGLQFRFSNSAKSLLLNS
jgi:hypothetical protein